MDVSTIDVVALSDKGAALVIKHPTTKKPTDWKVRCVGSESTAYRNASIEAKKSTYFKTSADGKVEISGNGKSWFENEQEAIDRLCACIVSWEGATENGKPLECNDVNKRRFLEQDWFRLQVHSFVEDQSNFFPKADAP